MDILLIPNQPTFPIPKTPFVGWDRWDCGPFLSFATRKELLNRVPLSLRHPDPAFHIPYTELLYPSSRTDTEGLYLAWFYFGLIAEVSGLNEGPGRDALGISEEEARVRCAGLYDNIVVEHDGKLYLSGARVYSLLETRLKDIMSAREGQGWEHIPHLQECLRFTFYMINSIHSEFDGTILTAITAFGEICTISCEAFYGNLSVNRARSSLPPPSEALKPVGIPWGSKSLRSGVNLESSLLATGWCPSEIEKVRQAYTGLCTVHFLSRLGRSPSMDHSSCTKTLCTAMQIDLASYKLSHVGDGCNCADFEVDIDEVQRVLQETDSFPILLMERLEDGSINLIVEAYQPGTKYVALSHVWADGLGNPRKNAIQICQLDRLATLVANLQSDMEPHTSTQYRLWIDTLCCPVEYSGKMIALGRIVQVYRDATHVLVLDSSISSYSAHSNPAELLLRAFCTSLWMRRLWTLQEGALSKSLCFQFADRAVRDSDLTNQLKAMATSDPRLYQISAELEREIRRVHGLTRSETLNLEVRLFDLQWAIFFRTVTVPSDEPICLATLLSLDISAIAAAPTHQDRMALDQPMTKSGFRWAPLSLLRSSSSVISANDKAIRFGMAGLDASAAGVPTPRGLRVRFAGARIGSRPLAPGFELHPWRGMLQSREDMLQVKHDATGTWYRLADAELLRMSIAGVSEDDIVDWYREAGDRICEALHGENMALVYDSSSSDTNLIEFEDKMHNALLLSLDEGEEGIKEESSGRHQGALLGKSIRVLVMNRLSSAEVIVAEGLRELARLLAREAVTRTLMTAPDRDIEGPVWKEAKEAAKPVMKAVGTAFWDSRPEFASAVDAVIGPDMKDFAWVMAVKSHSHDLVLIEDFPPDQAWIVD
ncbi:hypothetical protein B0I35DRAFT_485367 [Stachybotrys elegans]|uniref:Heterokaryon incompatibility domain-containing protein n=1 Tax=Stachybotrys elegans TaxID=80388 RepID=A0A8K0WIK7_9HYPO|nr:hypothetical protein B0I35DRAFT_485367 [Stachybotrys elegans]